MSEEHAIRALIARYAGATARAMADRPLSAARPGAAPRSLRTC